MTERWLDIGDSTPPRGSNGRISLTSDNFYKIIEMRDELIFEQKDEISKLKHKANNLESKVKRLQKKLKEQRWILLNSLA